MATLIADIETNGLEYDEVTQIWCISISDGKTITTWDISTVGGIQPAVEILHDADEVVFHNGILYDIPIIKKFFPWFAPKKVTDTFILSSLFTPDRIQGHALESYGRQFGIPKLPDLDWKVWSPGMVDRCEQDVRITLKTWEHFNKVRETWDWEPSIRLEHAMFQLQAEQERNGVVFDKERADALLEKLDKEVAELDEKLLDILPMRTVQAYTVPVSKPFLKNGGYTKAVTDWFGEDVKHVKGPFSRIKLEQFNLNSDDQIKNYLLSQGWVPTTWNYKKKNGKVVYEDGRPIRTSPKLTEDSFATIKGDTGKLVARRNILTHRRRNIKNYEDNTKGWYNQVRADGRIEAQGIPQGTPTARYRHKKVVNVPKNKASVVYGAECRELFTVPKDRVMAGCDAKGLEARVEAHYCYDFPGGPEYARELLNGDIHANNAKIFGLKDRDDAKAPKYALTYGCQWKKLQTLLKCSASKAQRQWNGFWDGNTALKGLRDAIEKALTANKGWVKGLDGRKIFVRSKHAALNSVIQSAGSIIVKTAMCYVWRVDIPKEKWMVYPKLLIQQHDEWQAEIHPWDIDKYRRICEEAFVKTANFYKLNVPLEGEVKVGHNWSETH
jgi:DNA polymerase-1